MRFFSFKIIPLSTVDTFFQFLGCVVIYKVKPILTEAQKYSVPSENQTHQQKSSSQTRCPVLRICSGHCFKE